VAVKFRVAAKGFCVRMTNGGGAVSDRTLQKVRTMPETSVGLGHRPNRGSRFREAAGCLVRSPGISRRGRPSGGPGVGCGTHKRAARSTAPTVGFPGMHRARRGRPSGGPDPGKRNAEKGRRTAPPLRMGFPDMHRTRRGRPSGGPGVGCGTHKRAARSTAPTVGFQACTALRRGRPSGGPGVGCGTHKRAARSTAPTDGVSGNTPHP